MKVVIVGPAFPLRGGIADFNEALSRAFNEAGIESQIFSFYYQYPSLLFPGTSQFSDGPVPEGITIHSTISSVNPISWKKTANKIIAATPDLVLVRYWLPFMAPSLGTISRQLRKKGIPVLAITDNVIPHEKRIGDNALTKYFVNSCKGFVTLSKSVLEDLSAFTANQDKIFLPHPIYSIFGAPVSKESGRKALKLNAGDKIILFFGFIRPYKGLDLLLDAMADPRVEQLGIKLLVAGEFYEDEKIYTGRIDRLHLSDRVLLHTSFIPKDRVKSYFCAADIVVQPYRSATQSGITQIAYHFDRPMLVTNIGGLSEIVPDQKVGYVTDISASAIADALVDFYSLQREAEFSANVRSEKEKFSWPSFVEGIIRLYEKVR
ncbi:MAG TPA: glycosyltransferase [Bacteroidia bacterium]|nr:glycosyltransferase [Bacteroidia bacterium]